MSQQSPAPMEPPSAAASRLDLKLFIDRSRRPITPRY